MKIGTVKEIKNHEYRVGLTPSSAKSYISHGHEVYIQTNAGTEAGYPDESYIAEGVKVLETAKDVFDMVDMIVKVKEPQPSEYPMFKKGQILYTYLHLAADKALTEGLLISGIKGIAYETMELPDRSLPCLKPMSEIAGRLSVQEGAKYLEKAFGGRGVLLGGVPGVRRGKIAILGGGVVGTNACKMAVGMGADVTILDISAKRLEYLDDIFGGRITTLYSTPHNIEEVLKESDVVIGAVLIPGAKAPKLVKREHLKLMKPGAVLVDVAVDQGGCFETTHPTTHEAPTFIIDGVVHYCVANMPGSVSVTSTEALNSVTIPYGLQIADKGLEKACIENRTIKLGLNVYEGMCVYKEVADDLGIEYTDVDTVLK
ncbi:MULTISPECIES: alanine dehydrogenase [unclassified Oceanispirochaeta]|uniref:alanine dehydrogenase n=1 Tax=unclassified Oceanispirochaeta TaxID=2635722 RepID=UPI000E09A82C|nr:MULTISPECIES: alanine dehydrogenase [unclassified Oceanispirochaeta]MBF9016420.1 alanine dehydrogenase [Oceanispirochaeta sp. M2]NPD72882.1 alanine dehydrogenase [Oceanispirochaeta sp. M1]RDG31459.1 alanine dehydrogenase [Oceanispirochaeta sp. M1]